MNVLSLILCSFVEGRYDHRVTLFRKCLYFCRGSVLGVHWKDWCWSWNSNTLATWCKKLTHWKRPWCWERLRAEGEGDDRGWDGWMASGTQWTWVWVDSGSWWWTGRPGVLRFMGSQRVGHDWETELNWIVFLLYILGFAALFTKPVFFCFVFCFLLLSSFIFLFFFNLILFLNLKHCISFAKHQNESATGIRFIFWSGPFFKSFVNSLQYGFCVMFWIFAVRHVGS